MPCSLYSQFLIGCLVGTGMAIAKVSAHPVIDTSKTSAVPSAPLVRGEVATQMEGRLAQGRLTNQPDFFDQGQEQLNREINRLQQSSPDPVLKVDSASGNWQPITSNAGNFSIWMPPGTLTEETKDVDTAIGRLSFKVIASNLGNNRAVVAYADLPANAVAQPNDKIFSALRDRLKSRTDYSLVSDRSTSLMSYSGHELTFEGSGETITIRYYLVKGRIYLIGAKHQGETINQLATTFLNSFQLLN